MFKLNLRAVLNTQRPDTKGLFPLRIRVTIKGKVYYHKTGIMLLKSQWKNDRVINNGSKDLYNLSISQQMAKIEHGYIEQSLTGNSEPVIKQIPKDFYGWMQGKINNGNFAAGTVRHKEAYLNKMRTFKQSLNFSQVNAGLLTDFENYCRKLGNKENTVWSSIKFLKTFIHLAQADGLLKDDCIKGYKGVKYENPQRQYLTGAEIAKIEKFATAEDIPDTYRNAANWFLLSCYSGLRYSDAFDFTEDKIINGKITIRTNKTGSDVSIIVHPKLKEVIKRLKNALTSNQDYNRNLKAVGMACKINKPLTSHLGRHSFSVNFLENGGSMEVLSKLLGHSTLKTTSIYGKLTDKRIDAEMIRAFK